jgi:hypothetical protein
MQKCHPPAELFSQKQIKYQINKQEEHEDGYVTEERRGVKQKYKK